MEKCSVFMLSLCRQTDEQTDRWTDGHTEKGKTICPGSFDTGA